MAGRKRILIVEDESVTALYIKSLVENYGFEAIDIALTGRDAIKTAIAEKPDLILMDIMLADDIDGITASCEIQKQVDIPVLYITASIDKGTRHLAGKTRMIGYIHKPLQEKDLFKYLDTFQAEQK